ncbi:MAG: hypothetical protein R8P61_23530 [Bacteroidia bacterium]|nr:hypothetical protein [Bacteroidia bacterium]
MKAYYLPLLFLGLMWTSSFAQLSPRAPLDTARLEKKDYSFMRGKLYARIGLGNIIHLVSPSLDLGVEYVVNRKFSALFQYGLGLPRLQTDWFPNRFHFPTTHKFWASLRYVRIGRYVSTTAGNRFFPSFYEAESFYSRGKTRNDFGFAVGYRALRINYTSADIRKWQLGFNLRTGYLWKWKDDLELEYSFGVGTRWIHRNYTIFSSELRGRPPNLLDLRAEDDRQLNRVFTVKFLHRISLSYRLR